jgi:hypothetical protein
MLQRLPNLWLLLSLISYVLLYPFLEQAPASRASLAIFDLIILFFALRASRISLDASRFAYVLASIAAITHILSSLMPNASGWLVLNYTAQAVFHAFVVMHLLRYILKDEIMTRDELFAAACLYVLLAFVFAYLYALVEHFFPGAFVINEANNPDKILDWWEMLYFSFTCLTSVGFGEITPVDNHARSLVMIQQMLGVLYFALVVSRLVGMQSKRQSGNG